MIKRYLFILLPLTLLIACNNSREGDTKSPVEEKNAPYKIDMHFAKQSWSEKGDTLFLRFRIADKNNRKITWADLKQENSIIREDGGNPPDKEVIIKRITQKEGKQVENSEDISHNVVCWFMVDRSKTISDNDMQSMMTAIEKTIETLPDSSAYISFFDKQITERELITKNNFHEFEKEFKVTANAKNLYQSIMHNFEFFVDDPQKQDAAKYLLVFTDGKIDENSFSEVKELLKYADLIKEIDNTRENHVQIHAFRYGAFSLADQALISICKQHRKPELKGGFYPAENVAGIIDSLRGLMGNLTADYELILINNVGKIYNGTKLTLQVVVAKENEKAVGKIEYAIGSKEVVITTGETTDDIYLAVILGVIIVFIAFFIMQVGVPYLIFRSTNFEKKYVKPYEPIATTEGEVHEVCSHCQEPLERGELIVVKCPHKIHWDCWIENGYKCVEYGQNCKDGIQFHFDKKHPFDLKKSPYYLKWAMAGMISGLFIWIVFRLTLKLNLFSGFINGLLNTFAPDAILKAEIEGELQILSHISAAFHQKISGFLLVGMLLGFILTFLFGYINDFRQKKGKVLLSIFIRSLIGLGVGFIAFLIGSIICILSGASGNKVWIDAIPWILFGTSIAACLAFNATIKMKDALIGGLISGIVSFLILYTTSYFPAFGVMFSFMLCSAGLGISIITRHHLAQKYFLKYKGEKREGIIAIHKWMNESGGSNEVTIGKSNYCIVQMNWDSSEKIQDMQVKLYIDPKRRVPMMKAIENGMIFDGREAKKDDQLPLKNGVKFKIGNTEFQYMEK